jgi:inner membrane protein
MNSTAAELWSKSKLLIKAFIIIVQVLLLLIPVQSVKELIEEREARQQEAVREVSQKWAGRQTVTGPILVLPYWKAIPAAAGTVTPVKQYAYFLPSSLTARSTINPEIKHRGIYQVMLYNAALSLSGRFDEIRLDALSVPEADVIWNEAFLRIQVSDTKGLSEEMRVTWKDSTIGLRPDVTGDAYGGEGLSAPLHLSGLPDLNGASFSANLQLNGSEQLLFTPVGSTTTVTVAAPWPHPSFTGNTLPQTSQVGDSGFTATWKSLALRRSFPQQFTDARSSSGHLYELSSAAFGVDLFVPVNAYQKTMRSVKYAALCILLTFAAVFLIEVVNKRSVHPFQYGLVGLALVLFYTLLLSIAEYTGFDMAYLVASVFTIGLIGWFARGVLASGRMAVLLSTVLVLVYGYVFTLLQVQDFALLLGSIGLFITLAIVMYFSRRIQW